MTSSNKYYTGAIIMCDPSLLVDATAGTGTEKHMGKMLVSKKQSSGIYFKLKKTQE